MKKLIKNIVSCLLAVLILSLFFSSSIAQANGCNAVYSDSNLDLKADLPPAL